VPFLQRSDNAI